MSGHGQMADGGGGRRSRRGKCCKSRIMNSVRLLVVWYSYSCLISFISICMGLPSILLLLTAKSGCYPSYSAIQMNMGLAVDRS